MDAEWRNARLKLGRRRRIMRWEYWPTWAIYLPIFPVIAVAAICRRGVRTVTLVNPAMPSGGLIEDSKADILEQLRPSGRVADFFVLRSDGALAARVDAFDEWMEETGYGFPIVLKPDLGERGRGVVIARDRAAALEVIEEMERDVIVQRFIGGIEYGVFYERHPDEEVGRITGLTLKDATWVTGDGSSTLEQLILADERAVNMAELFCDLHSERLKEVPGEGERVKLNQLGTHSQGSIFRDASGLITPEMAAAVDAASKSYEGFHLGRYDVRVADAETMQRGEDWWIVELNGATSEPTHMYDPDHSVWNAWRLLACQWWRAFAYGAANRRKGKIAPSWKTLRHKWAEHKARL